MSWALWLLVPIGAAVLAAVWTWWLSRPARVPEGDQAMQAHRDYLDALVVPARGAVRVERL
ncbi:MAG TPA: hypothetical protein VKQ07_10655 [Jatrophihabitantaceae bacterium]|nr:hypothetical protein [Jatrophihabitantaceae bacterium]